MIRKDIEYALTCNQKMQADIIFVSYYVGPFLQTRQRFYCSYFDYLSIIGDSNEDDIMWINETQFVGYNWWLQYHNGSLHMYSMPTLPAKERKPLLLEIKKRKINWSL